MIHAIKNEIEKLEEKLPEKKWKIFTVSVVALAAGTTIGVIVYSLTKGLKSVATSTGVGIGLKDLYF